MSIGQGYDFDDDLNDVFYPETKTRAWLNLITLPLRLIIICLLVIPLTYFIAVGFGFFHNPESKEVRKR